MLGNVLDFSVYVHSLCVECVYQVSQGLVPCCLRMLPHQWGAMLSAEPERTVGYSILLLSLSLIVLTPVQIMFNYWKKGSPNPAKLTTEHYKTVTLWQAQENTPSPWSRGGTCLFIHLQ